MQLTLIQIDNYGPWTEESGFPEAELLALQAEFYAAACRRFSAFGGLVFQGRQDNLLAVSNGISAEQQKCIQRELNKQFPFTTSMAVATGTTAYEAHESASSLLQAAGSAQDPRRKSRFLQRMLRIDSHVQIIHLDINHATQWLTDKVPEYASYRQMRAIEDWITEKLAPYGALTFFIGGDNFIALADAISARAIEKILEEGAAHGIDLKAGVGIAPTAAEAVSFANEGLHRIRTHNYPCRVIEVR